MSKTYCPFIDAACYQYCVLYDESDKKCSFIVQTSLLKNIDASFAKLVDKQECKAPVEVELQPVNQKIVYCDKSCNTCKYETSPSQQAPCLYCFDDDCKWQPK